ncbi:MAG: LysR family transcriptional regulator, partial [Geminicoccaceae bacterium]
MPRGAVMVERRIKFRHLQCFLKVAQQQSVVKAADVLALTQPAVSRTIRELEEYLNASLFDRSKRGVRLSTTGEVFLRYAGASVAAFNQGIDSIQQAQKTGQSAIRIGVLPTVAARQGDQHAGLLQQRQRHAHVAGEAQFGCHGSEAEAFENIAAG